MALDTAAEIENQIAQLTERKNLVVQRDKDVPAALDTLKKYASVLTVDQRKQVAKLIGEAVTDAPVGKRGRPPGQKAATTGKPSAKVPPKFQLLTGETWTGRGRTPLVFLEWSKANPGQPYPPAPGAKPAKATKKAAKKAGKRVTKKAATKKAATAAHKMPAPKKKGKKRPGSKPVNKTAAKKITRKPAKKATKRATKKAAA